MHSFAEAYGWTYDECLKKTMPQIIMLSHMADIARRRLDKRVEKGRKTVPTVEEKPDADPITWNGKRLSEMSSEDYKRYSAQF